MLKTLISPEYTDVASRVIIDSQDYIQEDIQYLASTSEGNIRWDRLEGFLNQAKNTQRYAVTDALDQLTDYHISDNKEKLLNDLAEKIVEGDDSLGTQTYVYLQEVEIALKIQDKVAVEQNFRSIRNFIEQKTKYDVEKGDIY